MKTELRTALLLAVAVFGLATSAPAQGTQGLAQEFQRIRQQFNIGSAVQNHRANITPRHQQVPTHSVYPPAQIPTPIASTRPTIGTQFSQYPVHVSPNRFNRINPFTGGIDTTNEQVDNTYYDRHRDTSKNNGTRRWVRRPIYDVHGNISGYQEGYIWINSVTGVEHGELKNTTKNDRGGFHEQIQVRSVQGPK